MRPRDPDDYCCCGCMHVKTGVTVISVIRIIVGLLAFVIVTVNHLKSDAGPTPWDLYAADAVLIWSGILSSALALVAISCKEASLLLPSVATVIEPLYRVAKQLFFENTVQEVAMKSAFSDTVALIILGGVYLFALLIVTFVVCVTWKCYRHLKKIERFPFLDYGSAYRLVY
ncbi:hypothetical protein QR680_004120 [Steinernema hermaphroditum]|uniref:Uncharacterized protein n=1 Tax=Steinernema hermaphroditum TaxID=289476 RepID=A0AA39HPZ1_9BILA|nr:hypothetical protein QR680_004120 [Steinernema hermaphroditum]